MSRLIAVLLLCLPSWLHAQMEFSQENARELLKVLAYEIGPRTMGSPADQRALQFAADKLRHYGCDMAYVMPIDRTRSANTKSGVAVGIMRGATDRIIVIGGHIDSAEPEIPGADDDGSGCAVVMETARVLWQRKAESGVGLESTIVFACFGGEERGLVGSDYFVEHFEEMDSVVLMLQIDMANGLGILEIDGDTHGISTPPWLVRAAVEEFYDLGYENLRYPTHFFAINYAGSRGSGSDHQPFLEKGIPAIDFTTDVSKPIHTPQDNLDNFDARGLKRSGDLVLRLIERFDKGVPDKQLANYWLYLVWKYPIFVPYWAIWVFVGISFLLAVWAFVSVRKRRLQPKDGIKWSALKMLLFTLVMVVCGALSLVIMGLVKGYRYPWFTDIYLYYVLAILAAAFGAWLSLHIAKKLRLTSCPYTYHRVAAIVLVVYLLLLMTKGARLAVPPAAAVFLFSAAMLVKPPVLRYILMALSPIWMLRLIFSEWDKMIFRIVAATGTSAPSFGMSLLAGAVMILLLTLYIFPYVLGFAALYRDSKTWLSLGGLNKLQSRKVGWVLAVLVVGMMVYLYPRDVYSFEWYRTVHVEQIWNSRNDSLPNSPRERILLRSKEYLDGVRVKASRRDTLLSGRITEAYLRLTPVDDWDLAKGMAVQQNLTRDMRTTSGDRTIYDIEYDLICTMRPYTVTISYSPSTKEIFDFATPWLFTTEGKRKVMRWYSFPDQKLTIPLRFEVAAGDSVTERIEVVFDNIMYDWKFERPKTNFIKRTRMESSRVLKGEEAVTDSTNSSP